MATTAFPQDKYAFLFTGPTLDRFLRDLENVFQMLTEFYNYPPGNITVAMGSIPAIAPSLPGATVVAVASEADLNTALTSFAAAASGPTASGDSTTALLYFTGGGIKDGTESRLVIDGSAAGAANVSPSWLQARLNLFSDCHVNAAMQQAYSGGFVSALSGSALSQWSFTHAASDAQDSLGNNTLGSFFTHGWVRGFQLEPLPAGTPDAGLYADQLGSAAQASNLLVMLEEGMDFGKQIHDQMGFAALSTPGYVGAGGPQYLGEPELFIRDGGAQWWESPDIELSHPNHPWIASGDLYIPDAPGAVAPFNNTVEITTRNLGTHPVRTYSLGIEIFKSGMGAVNDRHDVFDHTPSGILLPMDQADIGTANDETETVQWNAAFTQGVTHGCVKAEAKLLAGNVDYSWSVLANDFEGQRNTDEMTIAPPPPSPMPLPEMRGFMKHSYSLYNRFKETRRFFFVLPEDLQKYEKLLGFTWFEEPPEGQADLTPLKVVREPAPHIPLNLKAGEAKNIFLRVDMKPAFGAEQKIQLPFEILVEGDWDDDARRANNAVFGANFVPLAGLTTAIARGAAAVKGKVVDAEGKAMAEARVFMRTVNDQQGGVLTVDGDGRYAVVDINPDVYKAWAEYGHWRSKEQIIVLQKGMEHEAVFSLTDQAPMVGKRVKVILDKIRILDDHDPCLKGKGEVIFSAIVVPDNDPSRRQVKRLPANGVFKVSDKPGKNDVALGVCIFNGDVKNNALSITISGREIDFFDKNDELKRYRREFAGDPQLWQGQYCPSDECLDREDVGDWALWYRIICE